MKILCMVVAALLAASPLLGDSIQSEIRITTVAGLPSCTAARDGRVYVVTDGTSTTDCATGSSTEVSVCVCSSGSWASVASGGSGTSVILDLADDGTNESAALAEIAVTNDTGGAFTEPSADKLLIDVDKIGQPMIGTRDKAGRTMLWSCEFDTDFCSPSSTSLSVTNWTAGSVAPWAQVAANTWIYDFTTWPGWVLNQINDGATDTNFLSYSLATELSDTTTTTIIKAATTSNGGLAVYAGNEYTVAVSLTNSSDSNEAIILFLCESDTSGCEIQALVRNNGTDTFQTIATPRERVEHGAVAVYVLWRNGNTYTFATFSPWGGMTYIGHLTKTGETTFDTLNIHYGTSDNDPSPITGFDYIRIYPDLIVPPME